MALQQIFDSASSVMTVISFTTFLGIVAWTYVLRKRSDFDGAAYLPFADEAADEESERG
jgi:cytochrome c oxidase cbb3-type subunit 4